MDVTEEALVDAREDLGRPVTAGDVVDELGIARRTAHNKLGALVERGVLETRKIGARGRVWWRPIPADSVDTQPPRDARQSPEKPGVDDSLAGGSARRRPLSHPEPQPPETAVNDAPTGLRATFLPMAT